MRLLIYDQVIHLDPYDFHAYRGKAQLLARIQRDEDALAVYDQFIEQNPHSFEGYWWKLLFISERKRYADGLATCEQCIASNPHLAQAYEWRGHMLHYVHRDEEALASYEEAHRLDPGDEGILLSKARHLRPGEAFRRGIGDMRASYSTCPNHTLRLRRERGYPHPHEAV